MSSDWKKTSDVLIKDGYRKIIKRTFVLPNGTEVDYEIKKEGFIVSVLPMTSEQKVLLVKQFRVGPEQYLVELPGGAIQKGEDPQAAAARELFEETGYKGELQFVTTLWHDAYSTHLKHIFVAVNCHKQAEPMLEDNGEELLLVKMNLADFRNHLRTGQLTDVATGYLGLDFLGLV